MITETSWHEQVFDCSVYASLLSYWENSWCVYWLLEDDTRCSSLCNKKLFWIVCHADQNHDDVIKWKHFPRCWPFVKWIHRSPVDCPHKGQWRGALQFSFICAWTNDWANNGDPGYLRRPRAHYNVNVVVSVDNNNDGLRDMRLQNHS